MLEDDFVVYGVVDVLYVEVDVVVFGIGLWLCYVVGMVK